MYSTKVIEAAVARYESKAGHRLTRIPASKCADWLSHLSLKKSKGIEQTAEDRLFIRNERVMSRLDFRYWSERYAVMQQDGGGVTLFAHPWGSQDIALRLIARLEEAMIDAAVRGESINGLLIVWHKARQLGACLVAGTRVLTADLRWVPIEDVQVGDKLVAMDEQRPQHHGVARKMRVATVLNTVNMISPTYKIKLDDGTEFIGTPHHRFLAKKYNEHGYRWIRLDEMKPGFILRKLTSTWSNDQSYEDGWFGGFLDGEGSVRYKKSGGCELCGAQIAGKVLDRAVSYLAKEGYKFRFDIDSRKSKGSSKLGDAPVYKVVVSRMHDIFRLVGTTRPSRFIEKEWWVGKELPNNGGDATAVVVEVSSSLYMRVFDIETTTGTYVAEGFASHNTALGRLLMMHRATTVPSARCMSASVDDDKIMEMYDRDKLVYDNLPAFLQPSIDYDEKAQHLYFSLGSKIIYQVGSQKSGLGVGRQFELSHITECSTWPNPLMIELDFFPAIPRSLLTLSILESTAYGRGNWWHEFSENVRKGLEPRWSYLFIPWYAELSKYRSQPPTTWEPSKVALLHAQKVHDTSPEYVGHTVMLPRENLYWWESERAAAQRKGRLNFFLTNYCATPEESFQHSGQSPFDAALLEELRLNSSVPEVPYAITA